MSNDKYLTVSALTRYMKRKLDADRHLQQVFLKGELSNFKHHSRGHMYFTIKDDQAKINCVMFSSQNRSLAFTPENGMNILVRGSISVFEPYGQYQLYVQFMEPDGLGSLHLAFEQLKERLNKQGYFEKSHKQSLPTFPKHIGIVTSPTGAAIRDILTTLKRRYPIAATTVFPVLVQGEKAADSIARAIEQANGHNVCDVLIVGRGGGSIEELWSFNEERVAKAIFQSEIPIVSAVGHETDVTISDFVADVRAPTPTGAAEITVPSSVELQSTILDTRRTLSRLMQSKISDDTNRLRRYRQSYALRSPGQLALQKEQELDQLSDRLERTFSNLLNQKQVQQQHANSRLSAQHPEQKIQRQKEALYNLTNRQASIINNMIKQKTTHFDNTLEKLELLNPLNIMKRGYAIPYLNDGSILHSIREAEADDSLSVRLSDGYLNCNVQSIKEDSNDNRTGNDI